jgi:type VI secretion system protein ImpB
MSNSFQGEVPRSRVNITLDLETGGAKKKTELPLKMLVMGDYSKGQAEGRLRDRERMPVNAGNIESVLQELSPRVSYSVPNTLSGDAPEVDVDLTFDRFSAFHPEEVARRIPQVNNMLAMRNLLKDLKSNLLDNGRFRRELEGILKDQPQLRELMDELEKLAPLQDDDATPRGDGSVD